MSASKKRVETIRAVVQSVQLESSTATLVAVDHELQEAGNVHRITPERRRLLLEVFHLLRALETAMKDILAANQVPAEHSLGNLLKQLSRLPPTSRGHLPMRYKHLFHNGIRVHRNLLMHQANAYPTSARQAQTILGEIESCFLMILK